MTCYSVPYGLISKDSLSVLMVPKSTVFGVETSQRLFQLDIFKILTSFFKILIND